MLKKFIMGINKIQNFIIPLVYRWALPFTCSLCSRPSGREQDLCRSCLNDLPIVTQKCPRCAQKIEGAEERVCGACLKNPPPFMAAHALFLYQAPIVSLIIALKFHRRLAYARLLGELMAEKIVQSYAAKPLPEIIIPVPLHKERLKERGFNQAVEIGRPIAKRLGLPLDTLSVLRIKNTASQMTLPAAQRKANIKGAFKVVADLSGKRVAILDDVMTTGWTLTELSRTLLEYGAASIEVWCCARA